MASKTFGIGEAADKLGLTVTALRQLADKGLIRCTWSAGGQRRFTEDALRAFRRHEETGSPRRSTVIIPDVSDEVEVEFEDGDLDDPDDYPSVGGPDDDPDEAPPAAVQPPAPEPRSWFAPRHGPPPAPAPPEPSGPTDDERLADIKRTALLWVSASLPESWRSKVVERLEREITPTSCPRWEAAVQHTLRAQAVVHRVADEYKAERAAEAERQRQAAQAAHDAEEAKRAAAKKREELIDHGSTYAEGELLAWDAQSRYQLREEIEEALEKEVAADWDEDDVEDLVDEVLEEWEEDGE